MWGYKPESLLFSLWFAARFDDVLNYIPARLVVYTYAIFMEIGMRPFAVLVVLLSFGEPNAGPVMAAGAGA